MNNSKELIKLEKISKRNGQNIEKELTYTLDTITRYKYKIKKLDEEIKEEKQIEEKLKRLEIQRLFENN